MLYEDNLLPRETIVYSWDLFGLVLVYGLKWSFLLMYISFDVDWDRFCIWVELPIQRRLCPIFVNGVGLPDIHEYSSG